MMAKSERIRLEAYQRYAGKCAARLGIEKEYICTRWHDKDDECKMGRMIHAHVHIGSQRMMTKSAGFRRGTICLNRAWFRIFTIKQWHHCIAHEIAHLSVRSNHDTPTFDRKMVQLGVANCSERVNARPDRAWKLNQRRNKGILICHKQKER